MDLLTQLRRDEGERLEVYLDSRGIRTAGVGHNLDAHGIDWPVGTPITQQQSDQWLQEDIDTVTTQLQAHLPWTCDLDDARLGVLQNMGFNLGVVGLLGFHHTLTLVQAGDYVGAAEAMLNSKWTTQVGARAQRLATQMSEGVWV